MIFSDQIGIIADDLTGANDTALQFQKRGAATKILLDYNVIEETVQEQGVWATSTESRNISAEDAALKVHSAVSSIVSSLNIEHFYKKIDSTVRGNIAIEALAMLNTLDMDAAVIIPAFPAEGRVTVGGYHLLKGVPIGRTEMAQDPHSPIMESHIPTMLKNQLGDNSNLVAHIELKTVMNGAGPILMKINELIKEGKKLIVADAISIVDIEQIILAINKSSYNILPTGTAAAATVLSEIWLPDNTNYVPQVIPKLPKLIISGSATAINSNQIEKLKNTDEFDNVYEIALTQKIVIDGVSDEIIDCIINNLGTYNTVLVHSSYLVDNFDGFSDDSLNAELTKNKFASMITDFLAELTQRVISRVNVLLVTLGGETSYKCCRAIDAMELTLIDEVAPAIALCIDKKDQFIITKSGNLGNSNTLVDIIKYINSHEQEL
ncbi:MAG: four-carbon acid sugar kinase family protein [Candidatus Gastranaerophilaceae bacterium]